MCAFQRGDCRHGCCEVVELSKLLNKEMLSTKSMKVFKFGDDIQRPLGVVTLSLPLSDGNHMKFHNDIVGADFH